MICKLYLSGNSMDTQLMEEIVKELKRIVPFKEVTLEGDLVLVATENPRSVFYAQVTEISRDESKRDEWWHVSLTILSVPPQDVVWTLRESQFTGQEIFSMAENGRFIKAVDFSTPSPVKKKKKTSTKRKSSKRPSLRVVK